MRFQKIMKLASIVQAIDSSRRTSFGEFTNDPLLIAPETIERGLQDPFDFRHPLFMRVARLEVKQSLIDAQPVVGTALERSIAPVRKYGGAAREIFEQASLTIQQRIGHKSTQFACGRSARGCARRRQQSHRRLRVGRPSQARSPQEPDARARDRAVQGPHPALDENENRRAMAAAERSRGR